MAASLEPRDLLSRVPRIATVPPVGDEQDHRPAVEHAAAPSLVEFLD